MTGEIRAAITDQLGRFSRLLDTKRWDALAIVFTADVMFDYGGGREGCGLAALRENFRRYLDHCGPSQHLLGSIIIDLSDVSLPVSSSYVQARHLGTGKLARQWFDTSGDYTDSWQYAEGVWRICRRVAHFPLMVGDPDVIEFETGEIGGESMR